VRLRTHRPPLPELLDQHFLADAPHESAQLAEAARTAAEVKQHEWLPFPGHHSQRHVEAAREIALRHIRTRSPARRCSSPLDESSFVNGGELSVDGVPLKSDAPRETPRVTGSDLIVAYESLGIDIEGEKSRPYGVGRSRKAYSAEIRPTTVGPGGIRFVKIESLRSWAESEHSSPDTFVVSPIVGGEG